MTRAFDVIVLGAGMAGASIAAELAPRRRLLLLEVEDQPGRHATGRSAAMFFESYGNATVRALTRASRAFLERPPAGLPDAAPPMSPRAALFVCDAARAPRLQAMLDGGEAPALRRITSAQAIARVPILRAEAVAGAAIDETGCDLDVAAIHQGCLRRARAARAQVALGAAEVAIERRGGLWWLRTRVGEFCAPVVVNATGAWADAVARQAGARPLGLQPMRRTAMLMPAPAGHDVRGWPLVIDVDETVYFKPDAGQLLLSPANEDPMPPCDAAPEELDVALAVARFEALTSHPVARITHRWAGLRSFFADRSPVAGFDAGAEGFFWLAGQGGYGIQMAPALARAAAALLLGEPLPADIAAAGVTAAALSPARPGLAAA
jgi:D-arginine dehydrogenase